MLQDRVGQDFWAAAVQSYLNPLPFLPFALMQQAGWPSLAIASVLAAIQSLGLLALYAVSRHLADGLDRPRLAATLMTALGAASPVIFSQIGSTFVDATTAPLVMVALWLLVARPGMAGACAAAALAGAAMALKWTNAPFAAGILAAAAFAAPRQALIERMKLLALACAAVLFGFALFYGWWGWRLVQEHGSPLFPLFNGIFRSPDAPAESFSYLRFIPQTIGQLATFPFRMALHEGWVHTEVIAPDLRPALVPVLLGALVLRGAFLRTRAGASAAATALPPVWRVPLIFFAVSLCGWLVTSSNGRYAVPLFLLHGPVLWLLMNRLIGERRAALAMAVLTVLQIGHGAAAGSPRWNAQPWTQQWLPATVPAALRNEPMLFVLVGQPSASFVAAEVHRDSVFVNPIGTVPLANNGPGWKRYEALRDRYAGRTRIVLSVVPSYTPEEVRTKLLRQNLVIDRLGLRIDVDGCDRIVLNDEPPAVPWLGPAEATPMHDLLACRATRVAPDPSLAAARAEAARIMDAFEERCPQVFSPRQTQVEGAGSLWTRAYGRYDLHLAIEVASGGISYRTDRQLRPQHIGTVATWRDDAARFRCALPLGGLRGIDTLLPHDAPR